MTQRPRASVRKEVLRHKRTVHYLLLLVHSHDTAEVADRSSHRFLQPSRWTGPAARQSAAFLGELFFFYSFAFYLQFEAT